MTVEMDRTRKGKRDGLVTESKMFQVEVTVEETLPRLGREVIRVPGDNSL